MSRSQVTAVASVTQLTSETEEKIQLIENDHFTTCHRQEQEKNQ